MTFGGLWRNSKFFSYFPPIISPPSSISSLQLLTRDFLSDYFFSVTSSTEPSCGRIMVSSWDRWALWSPCVAAEEQKEMAQGCRNGTHGPPFCFFWSLHHVCPWGLWVKNGKEETAFPNSWFGFCFSSTLGLEKKNLRRNKKRGKRIPKTMKDELQKPKLNNVEKISNIFF